jgi:glycosyltransferase involved in cell wall biosynthesis
MIIVSYGSSESDVERVARAVCASMSDVSKVFLRERAPAAMSALGGPSASQYLVENCVLCVVSRAPAKSLVQLAVQSAKRAGAPRGLFLHASASIREREGMRDLIDDLCGESAVPCDVVLCNGVGCCPLRASSPLRAGNSLLVECDRNIECTDGFALTSADALDAFISNSAQSLELTRRSPLCHFIESVGTLRVCSCVPFLVDSVFTIDDAEHSRRRLEFERAFSLHADAASVSARVPVGRAVRGWPRVCVVISTYNRWTRLLEALQSVFWQTSRVQSVVIVDDASTDSRYSLLQSIASSMCGGGEEVRVIRRARNTKSELGFACPAVVRNEGMRLARSVGCDLIAVLDDDDLWLPWKMESQLVQMRAHGSPAACSEALYSAGRWVQQSGAGDWVDYHKKFPAYNRVHFRRNVAKVCSPYLSAAERREKTAVVPAFVPEELLLKKNVVVHSSFVCHESLFPDYEKIRYGRGMDYAMAKTLASRIGYILYVDNASVVYEGRVGSSSADAGLQ